MNKPPPLPVRVCPRHGLVAGPDGRCVICHRGQTEIPASTGSGRTIAAVVLVSVGILGGVLVLKGMRGKPAVAVDPGAVNAPARAPAAPPPAPDDDPAPAAPDEEKERRRHVQEQQRQKTIEEEMHKVHVRMFMTKACDLCDTARAWLKQNGMTYSEIDVGSDPAALEAMHKLTPGNEVPVFEVDGEVLVGFGPTNVAAAVRRAADRRSR